MSKTSIVRILLISILSGIFIFTFYPDFKVFLMISAILIIIFLFNLLSINKQVFLFVFIGLFVGFFRIYLFQHNTNNNDIDFYIDENEERTIEGIIERSPVPKDQKVKYILGDITLGNKELDGQVQFQHWKYPVINHGDRLILKGKIIAPPILEDFNYKEYLAMNNIYALLDKVKIVEIKKSEKDFSSLLSSLKIYLENRIKNLFPEPHASFLNGLLFGSRTGLPDDVSEAFRKTGLTHIIAISGYNITLIIVVVLSLLGFLPRKIRLICAGIFIIIFTIFVGAEAAVVRACLMGVISILALYTGRTGQISTTLLIVANIMVLNNYRVLVYDVGFQLSFTATMGLIYISPFIKKYFQCVPEFFSIRESLLLTISAQITALPIILFHFGNLSVVSPIANVLVAPFIPLAMFFGFAALLVSFISFYFGIFVGFGSFFSLDIILKITKYLSKLPFSNFEIPGFSIVILFIYYGFLIWVVNKRTVINDHMTATCRSRACNVRRSSKSEVGTRGSRR